MASNQTENYGLNQWEAEDKVLRTDFNADNAKIDTAIKAAADLAEEGKALGQAAFSPDNAPVIFGTYQGDGSVKRKVSLPFTPRAVLVACGDGVITHSTSIHYYYGGLALIGANVACSDSGRTAWESLSTVVAIAEDGFYVTDEDGTSDRLWSNLSGKTYYYMAFR